jgi:hypothetical protein
MDFGAVGERILFVVVAIALVLLISLIRGRNPRKERIDIVGTLLEETKLNIILAQTFENQPQQRLFHVTGWQLRRKKIDFLDKELVEEINNSYDIALDFNKRLKATTKAMSNKKETIDIEKLRTGFPRIKQGLEDWLLAKTGTADHKAKPPGITDWLFGGRS